MPKYLVTETRTVTFAVEVPDGVAFDSTKAAGLNFHKLWMRGSGGIIADWATVKHEVCLADPDDDGPADVVLDKRLRDTWPPEEEPARKVKAKKRLTAKKAKR